MCTLFIAWSCTSSQILQYTHIHTCACLPCMIACNANAFPTWRTYETIQSDQMQEKSASHLTDSIGSCRRKFCRADLCCYVVITELPLHTRHIFSLPCTLNCCCTLWETGKLWEGVFGPYLQHLWTHYTSRHKQHRMSWHDVTIIDGLQVTLATAKPSRLRCRTIAEACIYLKSGKPY